MATIKSYTDLSQSKTLSKILPLESADMYWKNGVSDKYIQCFTPFVTENHRLDVDYDYDVPCWSLAALLGVIEHPRCFQGDKPTYWFCGCFGKDKLYHEVESDNPIDACYEMIMKLHKLNLL